eukprot:3960986-Prymnesium_polylepis.1
MARQESVSGRGEVPSTDRPSDSVLSRARPHGSGDRMCVGSKWRRTSSCQSFAPAYLPVSTSMTTPVLRFSGLRSTSGVVLRLR